MATPRGSRGAKKRQKVEEETTVKLAKIRAAKFVSGCIAIPLTVLAMTPVAAQLAGENTRVNVNVVMTLTLGVTIAWGVTGAAYAKQKKRADRLSSRNEQLQLDVAKEQGNVDLLEKQVKGLQKGTGQLPSVAATTGSSVAVTTAEEQTG
jgi:hypothetical protein